MNANKQCNANSKELIHAFATRNKIFLIFADKIYFSKILQNLLNYEHYFKFTVYILEIYIFMFYLTFQ